MASLLSSLLAVVLSLLGRGFLTTPLCRLRGKNSNLTAEEEFELLFPANEREELSSAEMDKEMSALRHVGSSFAQDNIVEDVGDDDHDHDGEEKEEEVVEGGEITDSTSRKEEELLQRDEEEQRRRENQVAEQERQQVCYVLRTRVACSRTFPLPPPPPIAYPLSQVLPVCSVFLGWISVLFVCENVTCYLHSSM